MPDQQTSLRDDLAAGFNGAETDPPAGDPGVTDTTAPQLGVSGEPVALAPPQHWSETDRSLFGTAPRPIQERWLSREKEINDGFTKHGQELSQLKKDREQFDAIFKDLDQDLQLNGLGRHQFVQQLVGWNGLLSKDPAAGLRKMAERLGVDLKTLIENPQAATDPKLQTALTKVEELSERLTKREREEHSRLLDERKNAIQAFADAKNPDGSPVHPYFDDVAEDIARLIRADGRLSLETAYNKALRLNDAVWDKTQTAKQQSTAAEQERKRKEQVDKARRAAAGSSGEGNGTTTPKTLRQDLEAAFSGWPA